MIETDRLVAAPATPQEEAFERTLRPRALDEYVGQEKIRSQLAIFIEAAVKRSITSSCSGRRGWARRRSRTSSRTSWA